MPTNPQTLDAQLRIWNTLLFGEFHILWGGEDTYKYK